jgi:hypothetical protein
MRSPRDAGEGPPSSRSAPESLLIDAERAAEQGRRALAALTLAAALDSLQATGAETGEAAGPVRALRDRALNTGAIDTGELADALRLARRAIRAASRGRSAS